MFFNGQHRKTPVVSLGGNSKLTSRQALLKRAAEERRKRQEQQQHQECASRIQRSWRSHRARLALERQLHAEFSTALQSLTASRAQQPVTATALGNLMVHLAVLYDDSNDSAQQLIQVCSVLLRHQKCFQADIRAKPANWSIRLKQFVTVVVRFLRQYATSDSVSISSPLRLLEVLLDPKPYSNANTAVQGQVEDMVSSLTVLICHKQGYFSTMLSLLVSKLPAPVEYSSRSPSPFAQALLGVLLLPLRIVGSHRDIVVEQLCKDLLPLSCHPVVRLYVLPALSDHLSLSELVRASPAISTIGECTSTPSIPSTDIGPAAAPTHRSSKVCHSIFPSRQPVCSELPANPTGWALYSLLQVVEQSYLAQQTDASQLVSDMSVLLEAIATAMPAIAPAETPNVMVEDTARGVENMQMDDSDSEAENTWSSPEAVLAPRIAKYLHMFFLQGQCERLLTNSDLCRTIVRLIDSTSHANGKLNGQIFKGLTSICSHYLLYKPSRFRQSKLFEDLCYRPRILRELWRHISTCTLSAPSGDKTLLLDLIKNSVYSPAPSVAKFFVDHISTFCALLIVHLSQVDADAFRTGNMVFSIGELSKISASLLDVSLSLLRSDTLGVTKIVAECLALDLAVVGRFATLPALHAQQRLMSMPAAQKHSSSVTPYSWAMCFQLMSSFLRYLHARDKRTPVFHPIHWQIRQSQFDFDNFALVDPSKVFPEGSEGVTPATMASAQTVIILRTMPFVTPFMERARLFLDLMLQDRMTLEHSVFREFTIRVRRSHVYDDAFSQLSPMAVPDLKTDLSIQLFNFQDLSEAGIDGGGVLREFLTIFVQEAFDSTRGLFVYTDDKHIYPNPAVYSLGMYNDPAIHYHFLGKMLGKVLFENLLVDLPFASFFIQKVIDGASAPLSLDHLESLDPEVYKNLLYMREHEDGVADLFLNFTVVNTSLGKADVVELKPGGANIAVTRENCAEYIAAVANYKLNTQLESQCAAFREGFASVVNISWLRLFTASEAQILISGAQVPLDLEDLQNNTHYSGGYHETHPTILLFWDAVKTFTNDQLHLLLKFVTSCSRPPLFGFKDFHPHFAIHNALSSERLPTASTCMNQLKLPPYEDLATLRDRLLYAITSGAGFELS
eukprot:scpid2186/ scgid31312/ Ubiquitin-protein ligase E3C